MSFKPIAAALCLAASLAAPSAQAMAKLDYFCPADSGAYSVGQVSPVGDGLWHYSFSVASGCWSAMADGSNQNLLGTQVLLPYFSDSGITNITAPQGWMAYVTDAMPYHPDMSKPTWGNAMISWRNLDLSKAIQPDTPADFFAVGAASHGPYVSGFEFDAPFAPVKAPFALMLMDGQIMLGDPPIPGSPNAINAGLTTAFGDDPNKVSEPGVLALLATAVLGLGAMRRREGARREGAGGGLQATALAA